jgi:hypothetical protein
MRYKVLTAVNMVMVVFWVVTACGLVCRYRRFGATYFNPEDGGSKYLRTFGIYLQVHTALLPRIPKSK